MPSIVSSSSKLKSNGCTQKKRRPPQPAAKVEGTHGRADGLVRRVVPHGEVRVVERLLAGDALCGVEVEQLAEQVDRERVRAREERLESDARLDR